jgi:hypothetical protein
LSDASNDNAFAQGAPPGIADPHGHAALLLVETILHVLIAKSVVSVADAVELVDDAADVARTIAEEGADAHGAGGQSVTLLMTISRSLRADLPRS